MRMTTLGMTLAVGLLTSAALQAADDDYLKALQAETARSLSNAPAPAAATPEKKAEKPAEKPKAGWSAADQELGSDIPPNLSQADFESALQTNFFGTYMFYSKLNTAQKGQVYAEYQTNNNINHIRDKTQALLKR